jgi:hypothetical protein
MVVDGIAQGGGILEQYFPVGHHCLQLAGTVSVWKPVVITAIK